MLACLLAAFLCMLVLMPGKSQQIFVLKFLDFEAMLFASQR